MMVSSEAKHSWNTDEYRPIKIPKPAGVIGKLVTCFCLAVLKILPKLARPGEIIPIPAAASVALS